VILSCRSISTPKALHLAARLYGISVRTLARWRYWWREIVQHTKWWQKLRPLLVTPQPDPKQLPDSLLLYLLRIPAKAITHSGGIAIGCSGHRDHLHV
jgi:hypothetical protein